jgi:hypothetical protein
MKMRCKPITILPMAIALVMAPRPGHAQVNATIQIGSQHYGHEIRVYPYSMDADGDWHTSYRHWRPVTVYSLNGRFYSRSVPGARVVQVYSYNNQYFLPPRDAGWNNFDRRYRYNERPQDTDYNIIDGLVSIFGQRPPRNWGSEVVVNTYSPEAYGNWRSGYRRWRPVTLYSRDNRYFLRAVPGSRPVSVYSWNNQYFLPPQDRQWDQYDRRFNYGRRPTDDDYRNVERIPGQYGQQPPAQPGQQPAPYPQAPGQRYGNELQVTMYSPQAQGDWRTAYNGWETATIYNLNGRYYPTQVPGARPLMVYRSQNQYFLPPQDRGWDNVDRRYDYRLRPTDDDYNNVQRHPGRRP